MKHFFAPSKFAGIWNPRHVLNDDYNILCYSPSIAKFQSTKHYKNIIENIWVVCVLRCIYFAE